MKSLRTVILYGTLIGSLFLLWTTVLRNPCNTVVEYDIGVFDERFRIERNDLIDLLAQAEKPWEQEARKDLFVFKEGADFKVNFVWSEEQERLYKGNDLSIELNSQEKNLDTIQSRYQSAIARYEQSLREYETKLKKYEKDVDYWNEQGGAPPETYNQLQQESKNLEKKAHEVNQLRLAVNDLAEQNNNRVEDYNDGVAEYNTLFSEAREFDAGNTDGKEINVYSYDGNDELATLLIHEFGHVLGIDHVETEDSVMYYLLNEENKSGRLSKEDISELFRICRLS